ncbi:MAG: protein-disulfide reductase DsbD domain-containing protein [Terriglobales bacterium]
MGFSRKAVWLPVLLVGAATALAQSAGVARIAAAPVEARAHSTAVARLSITVEPGFHIQSNHPKQDYLIPSSIKFQPAGGVSVVRVAWPAAKDVRFAFDPKQPYAVFTGSFIVPVTLRTAAAGAATLKGSFHYQACNDQLCKPPVSVPFTLQVQVR